MSSNSTYRQRKVQEDGEKAVFLTVKTTRPRRERIQAIARSRGLSVAQLVTAAMNKYGAELGVGELL